MHTFSIDKGPSLQVSFLYSSGKLLRTLLSLPATEGFFVKVVESEGKMPTPAQIEEARFFAEQYLSQQPISSASFLTPHKLSFLPPFTQEVLKALEKIPYGESRTYGEIASLLGRERAFRGVGAACGRNPFPLLIPCHRVLAHLSQLGGFAFGTEIKKRLLMFENIAFS